MSVVLRSLPLLLFNGSDGSEATEELHPITTVYNLLFEIQNERLLEISAYKGNMEWSVVTSREIMRKDFCAFGITNVLIVFICAKQ